MPPSLVGRGLPSTPPAGSGHFTCQKRSDHPLSTLGERPICATARESASLVRRNRTDREPESMQAQERSMKPSRILSPAAALAAAGLFAVTASAEFTTPRVSPKLTLTQTIGITDLTLAYSRPGVRGRTIWGGLVPYDKPWRTGANEATTFTCSTD